MPEKIDKSKIKDLFFITKETLRTISDYDEASLNVTIHRLIKKGELIKLKNGLYLLAETEDKYRNEPGFLEYIANRIRRPSYISLETVLRKHDILSEGTHNTTSVTTKVTRKYTNKYGNFNYRKIKKELFTGYEEKDFLGYKYHIATKSKALFDYFYYRKNKIDVSARDLNLAEEFRLNLETFTKEDFEELNNYARLSNNEKIMKISENLGIN